MKDSSKIDTLPYRKNISCILFKDYEYLLVQLTDWEDNWWKFPQGGVDEGETEKEALKRELREELAIKKIKIIGTSKYTNTYDWPENVVIKKNLKWRGQFQKFYLVKFTGKKSEIRIINHGEVRRFKWVTKSKLFNLIDSKSEIFSGYKEVIRKIFDEFEEFLK